MLNRTNVNVNNNTIHECVGDYNHLNKLDLPPHAINWIISYLSGRSQILKCEGQLSASAEINTSIVQGSGIGPMLFVVMESDLNTMPSVNILLKYADDTSLLVPSDSDTDLVDEFDNIKRWALTNKKNKELVFRRPNPRLVVLPVHLDQIEQVHCTKLLGIYLSDTLQFETHVVNLLKICSQRT